MNTHFLAQLCSTFLYFPSGSNVFLDLLWHVGSDVIDFSFIFLPGGSKIGADVMDSKRKEHTAYEYLCHLEEAKK